MRLWRGGATYTMMWRMPSFTTFDGRSLAFLDVGSGPAVVLLHGSGSKAEGCFGPRDRHEGLIAPLSISHRVLGLDARGHGASDKPLDPTAYGARAMARDVSALLDHLQVPSAALVGYSLGSYTAVEVALRDDRIHGLVLGGAGPLTPGDIDGWRTHVLVNHPEDDPLRALVRGAVLPQLCVTTFPTVTCPVTVLDSVDDPLDGAALADGFPNARHVPVPGNHSTALDFPEWFEEALSALGAGPSTGPALPLGQ